MIKNFKDMKININIIETIKILFKFFQVYQNSHLILPNIIIIFKKFIDCDLVKN